MMISPFLFLLINHCGTTKWRPSGLSGDHIPVICLLGSLLRAIIYFAAFTFTRPILFQLRVAILLNFLGGAAVLGEVMAHDLMR